MCDLGERRPSNLAEGASGWILQINPVNAAVGHDLRLGKVAYRLRASFLPGKQVVADRLDAAAGDGADATASSPASRCTRGASSARNARSTRRSVSSTG